MMCVFGNDNGGVVLRSAVISAVAEAIDKGTDIFAAIQSAPAVDAVVHGHWDYDGDIDVFRCSCCNDFIVNRYYFCPWCGAKMDEVVE